MHFGRRWLHLGIATATVGLLAACGGGSGESDPSATADAALAVSATPVPTDDVSAKVAGDGARQSYGKLEPVTRPGAEAPLDSTPDRIAKQPGSRLFATGFEEGVQLAADPSNGDFQYLVGGDASGYGFPIDLGLGLARLPSRINAEVGRHPPIYPAYYARGTIKTVAGRDGGVTRALSLHSERQSPRTAGQQVSLENADLAGAPVVYQRMWIKFDERTLERARQVGSARFYQTFWEASNGKDYWLKLKLHYDDRNGLTWVARADGVQGPESYWQAGLPGVPVRLAPVASPDGWHKVEVWLDAVSGRFKVSIDGNALVDRADILSAGGKSIKDYRMMMVASTVSPLTEMLFDDLEFWSTPPEDAWQK